MRGPRQKLRPNVFRDDLGIAGIARAGGRVRELRFPHGTPDRVIDAALDAARAQLRTAAARGRHLRHTLDADIARYLALLPEGRAKANTAWDLRAWAVALGTRPRATITVDHLRAVVRDWRNEPPETRPAASTINHRRRALAQLYDALDGADAPNPARRLPRVPETLGPHRGYAMADLDAAVAAMRTGPTRARLRFLLWTGMPPSGMQALDPARVRVELADGLLTYPPRAKGRGAEPVTLPLFPAGVAAVAAWLEAGAHGRYSAASLQQALRRAVTAYRAAHPGCLVPPTVRVYDLRHSFLTWLYQTSGDPYLVQLYGQHADLGTTQRYTRGGVPARALAAVRAVAAGGESVAPTRGTTRENGT